VKGHRTYTYPISNELLGLLMQIPPEKNNTVKISSMYFLCFFSKQFTRTKQKSKLLSLKPYSEIIDCWSF